MRVNNGFSEDPWFDPAIHGTSYAECIIWEIYQTTEGDGCCREPLFSGESFSTGCSMNCGMSCGAGHHDGCGEEVIDECM